MDKIAIIRKKGVKKPRKLISFLKKAGKKIAKDGEKCDLLIVIGGDGTILKAVQTLIPGSAKTPILGVNAGGLGVLTQIRPPQLIPALKKIFDKKYKLDRRTLLDIKINNQRVGFALNEAAINQGPFTRLINFEISAAAGNRTHAGRKKVDFCADGVIIATPSGSTAYSRSAGGPILKPGSKSFVITPICPAGRKQKPLIIPDTAKIKIRLTVYHNKAEKIGLSLDSQKNIYLGYKDTVRIEKAGKEACFIRPLLTA